MVSITLMKLSHKQFDGMARELMRKNIDMIFHTRHHVYTRTKKKKKSGRMRLRERRERIE